MAEPIDRTPDQCESPLGQRPEITGVIPPRHDPYAAFRSRGFRFFTTGNLLSIIGRQMLAVAVEWEIYRRTHSATALDVFLGGAELVLSNAGAARRVFERGDLE